MQLTKVQKRHYDNLPAKEAKFVVEFFKSGNKEEAYYKAGFISKNRVKVVATIKNIMACPSAKVFYSSLMDKTMSSAIASKDDIVRHLTAMISVDITDVVDFKSMQVGTSETGIPIYQTFWNIKDPENMPYEVKKSIKSITSSKGASKIEMYDNLAAIKQLISVLGYDRDSEIGISGRSGLEIKLKGDVNSGDVSNALNKLIDRL